MSVTPEEFEMGWDAAHPEGQHVYFDGDDQGNIDPDSQSEDPPYDTGEDED